MEINVAMIVVIIIAIVLLFVAVFFAICVAVSAIRFICEEINHTVKKFKREMKETWWRVEWKLRR